jgi:hypothetical protein
MAKHAQYAKGLFAEPTAFSIINYCRIIQELSPNNKTNHFAWTFMP